MSAVGFRNLIKYWCVPARCASLLTWCAGIDRVDLIKIDWEGAEADVFSTLPDEILNECQWIVGEFHDHMGFEVLARLAPHFHLDLKKKMFRPRFRFHACNLSKVQELSRSDLDALQR